MHVGHVFFYALNHVSDSFGFLRSKPSPKSFISVYQLYETLFVMNNYLLLVRTYPSIKFII